MKPSNPFLDSSSIFYTSESPRRLQGLTRWRFVSLYYSLELQRVIAHREPQTDFHATNKEDDMSNAKRKYTIGLFAKVHNKTQ